MTDIGKTPKDEEPKREEEEDDIKRIKKENQTKQQKKEEEEKDNEATLDDGKVTTYDPKEVRLALLRKYTSLMWEKKYYQASLGVQWKEVHLIYKSHNFHLGKKQIREVGGVRVDSIELAMKILCAFVDTQVKEANLKKKLEQGKLTFVTVGPVFNTTIPWKKLSKYDFITIFDENDKKERE